ncbi:MAG TPA: hypothetical protein VFC24_08535, partial [Casimicrobiaceae bacterium]|nr:hypothetical protein [Casimicrobiaceae bacterium]
GRRDQQDPYSTESRAGTTRDAPQGAANDAGEAVGSKPHEQGVDLQGDRGHGRESGPDEG